MGSRVAGYCELMCVGVVGVFVAGLGMATTPLLAEAAEAPSNPVSSPDSSATDPAPYDWSGLYAGLQLGGAFGSAERNFSAAQSSTGRFGIAGPGGGLTLGYLEQTDNIVYGVEGDFSALGLTGLAQKPNPQYIYQASNPWLMTARGRLGVAIDDFLPYVSGGLAVATEHIASHIATTDLAGSDFTRLQLGWTAGGGVEAALSDGWSVKAEYLYVKLADATGPASNFTPTSTSLNENIVRLGVNFRFGPFEDTPDRLDGATPPPSEDSDALSLATLPGFEIGGTVGYYRYQEFFEHDQPYMHETGAKLGVLGTGTYVFGNSIFVTSDNRIAYSWNNYTGSGTRNGVPDYLFDLRALIGRDFDLGEAPILETGLALSPYTGLGYRNLLNDLRGTSSPAFFRGYRRDSQYLYLPVGATARIGAGKIGRLAATVEYDQLVEGWQTNDFNDVQSGQGTPGNDQFRGFGFRSRLDYEEDDWSIGPYFIYWNVNQSEQTVVPHEAGFGPFEFTYVDILIEPHNQTIESGIELRYRF